MDHQRKRVYGYRQEILDGANCKIRILDMIDEQIDLAVERFLDDDYGRPASPSSPPIAWGSSSTRPTSPAATSTRPRRRPATRPAGMIPTQIHEAMDENLGPDVDPKEWNWQAMANQVNTRWGLKTTDRQLKQIGRDNLAQHLTDQAEKAIADIDLTEGTGFLRADWGRRSLCDWARLKFQIKLTPEELADNSPRPIKDLLHQQVLDLYRQKEIEFPVRVGMARFMADRQTHPGAGQRYDREGLFHWAQQRFPGAADSLSEEDFRTQSRARLQEMLLEVSRHVTRSPARKRSTRSWKKSSAAPTPPKPRTRRSWPSGRTSWAWKSRRRSWHRSREARQRSCGTPSTSATGRRCGHGAEPAAGPARRVVEEPPLHDGPSAVRHRPRELRPGGPEDRVQAAGHEGIRRDVGRRPGQGDGNGLPHGGEEGFQESVWAIGAAIHESAPQALPAANGQSMRGQQDAAITNSPTGDKKTEPIRNRGERVGRNDPCPCGSGKKYKNCHMRINA